MNAQTIIISQLNSLNSKILVLINEESSTGADLTKEIRKIDKQIANLHKKMVRILKVK